MRRVIIVAAATLLISAPAISKATSLDVVNTFPITVGDKFFSNFSFGVNTSLPPFSFSPHAPSDVDVSGITTATGEIGVVFTGRGGLGGLDLATAAVGVFADTVIVDINYDVSIVNASNLIHDFTLAPVVMFGEVLVGVQLFDANHVLLGGAFSFGSESTAVLSSDQSAVQVHTRIVEFPRQATPVSLRSIHESFSQVAAVPEPGTLFLLGSGLAGLTGIAWRRHRCK